MLLFKCLIIFYGYCSAIANRYQAKIQNGVDCFEELESRFGIHGPLYLGPWRYLS